MTSLANRLPGNVWKEKPLTSLTVVESDPRNVKLTSLMYSATSHPNYSRRVV